MTRAAVRPSRDEFARLCRGYTAQAIANRYGVTVEAVRQWRIRYGIRPRLEKTGRKRTSHVNGKGMSATPGPLPPYWCQGVSGG